ncbi:complex I subunit 4 family protein [Tumebacillus amylolyticus]|nr:NADH-quinone oxidoreductase subunit M [Tumebacillus amylolyticus]
MMGNLLTLIVFLPLLGALILGFVPRSASSQPKAIALIATFLPLLFAGILYGNFDGAQHGMQFTESKEWIHIAHAFQDKELVIGYSLGVDGLSLPFLLLTSIVTFLGVLATKSVQRVKEFFIWYLILVTGLYGCFLAQDLFLFFLFLEMTLVPMYFLIGIWGGDRKGQVATKFLIYRGLASVGILVSFVALAFKAAAVTGVMTMDMTSIANAFAKAPADVISSSFKHGIFLVLFLAILIEEAFFPFHTWLPDTHEQAPSTISMVVGGVLMKIGAYVLFRIGVGILPDAIQYYATLIAVIGVINIVYAALVAMVQKDWRRLLAFSAISHMGVVLLGVAALNQEGLQGGIFMTISSGLLSGLLFFLIGAIKERTGTTVINALGGLSKPMPILAGFLLAAALGSLGLPGMSGFISEILAFMGAFAAFPGLSAVGTLGIIFAAVYLLWAMQRTTYGPTTAQWEGLSDARAVEYVPMVVFVALIILIGVYPSILGDLVNPTISSYVTRIGG